MASLYDLLNAIIDNRSYRNLGNCAGSKTMKVTFPSSWRGLVHISNGASSGHGLYSVITTSTNGVNFVPLVASSLATLSGSTGGVLNIANSTSGNIYVAIIGTITKTVTSTVV